MGRRYKTGNSFYKIDGFEEVRDLFSSLQDRAPEVYKEQLRNAAQAIETDAKSNVHSISGAIVSSIKAEDKSSQAKPRYRIVAGGTAAPHAHLVEFGHRQITNGQTIYIEGIGFRKLKKGEADADVPAHPFLRKAFEQNKAKLLSALNGAIDKLLRKG